MKDKLTSADPAGWWLCDWTFDKGDEIEWSGAGRVKKSACWKVEKQV